MFYQKNSSKSGVQRPFNEEFYIAGQKRGSLCSERDLLDEELQQEHFF